MTGYDVGMEGLATDRLRLPAGRAPGGLALVQELVNTATRQHANAQEHASERDVLADIDAANRWLPAALAQWAAATGQSVPELQLAEADLAPLRRLRESIRALAAAAVGVGEVAADDDPQGEPHSGKDPRGEPQSGKPSRDDPRGEAQSGRPLRVGASVALRIDADGRVRHGTSATGWRGVAALVTAEMLLAQHTDAWQRFKTCPFPLCGVAFYDESRNNSRVWHDVRTCGNRTNLAASRERRRAAEAGAAEQARPGR